MDAERERSALREGAAREGAAREGRMSRRAVLGGGLGLLLVGCARLPVSSGISSTPVRAGSDPGAPYVQPRPPAEGASPEEIVSGFVQAGVGSEGDYEVARQYLAAEARAAWDPEAGITVYAGDQEFETSGSGSGTVRLALQAVAQVDAHGSRTLLASPSGRQIDIALAQENDQWRIAKPPPGIFLSEAAFEILFQPARAYFLDARARHLVPDLRWVPSRTAATTLLRHLGGGPAAHLARAVRTALPDGFTVADSAASGTTEDTARIEVPAALAALPADRRARAIAQIDASLNSLSGIDAPRIVAGGTVLAPDPSVHLERALPGHRPIGAGAAGIISLADLSGQGEAKQLVPDLAAEVLSHPVISQSLPLAAALSADGASVLIAATDRSAPRRDVALGAGISGPAVDDSGYVWTALPGTEGALIALATAASSRDDGSAAADVRILAPWLAGREIRSVDIAPDATRMLVVSVQDGAARTDLCGIVRGDDGTPGELTEPLQIPTAPIAPALAGWYDETAIIVLGSGEDAQPRAAVVDLATGADELPVPRAGTAHLAGTAVTAQVLASTDAAVLLRSDGSAWVAAGLAARDPSFY